MNTFPAMSQLKQQLPQESMFTEWLRFTFKLLFSNAAFKQEYSITPPGECLNVRISGKKADGNWYKQSLEQR